MLFDVKNILANKPARISLTSNLHFPKAFAVEQVGRLAYLAGGKHRGLTLDTFCSVNTKAETSNLKPLLHKRQYPALKAYKEN